MSDKINDVKLLLSTRLMWSSSDYETDSQDGGKTTKFNRD